MLADQNQSLEQEDTRILDGSKQFRRCDRNFPIESRIIGCAENDVASNAQYRDYLKRGFSQVIAFKIN